MKIKFLIPVMILWAGLTGLHAQTMVVSLNDGTEESQNLSAVQKLTFPATDLLVTLKNGSSDSYGLSEVRKVYFNTNVSVGENQQESRSNLKVFPNPAIEILNICGIPEGSDRVCIYRADGSLVISEDITDKAIVLNISQLCKGLYFISINGVSAKFVKP